MLYFRTFQNIYPLVAPPAAGHLPRDMPQRTRLASAAPRHQIRPDNAAIAAGGSVDIL